MTHPLVLVVDDDPDILDAICDILEGEGYRVARARHGVEALERVEAEPPSIILLDLMMPVMDGWEFRRHQKEDPQMSQVPVIVLSALDQARANGLAPDAFLKKPLDFDRLLELVRQYCH
jgi:CheY-like chemotaxis protein